MRGHDGSGPSTMTAASQPSSSIEGTRTLPTPPQWPLPGNHFLLFFPSTLSAFWTISAFKPYAHSPHSPVSAFKAIRSLRILISLCFQRTLRTLRTLLSDVSLLIIIVLLPLFDQFSVPICPLSGHTTYAFCFIFILSSQLAHWPSFVSRICRKQVPRKCSRFICEIEVWCECF